MTHSQKRTPLARSTRTPMQTPRSRATPARTLLVELANFITYGVMWVGKFMLFNKFLFAHRGDAEVEGPVVLVPASGADPTVPAEVR